MMSSPLSPAVMLATSMHAQPGVYAVLLGSGVSTGAGIPTGWGVVSELVRRVAAAAAPADASVLTAAESDPGAWWAEHQEGPLGYSPLLASLAPTPAARQGLLVDFFEPTDDERQDGIKTPSAARRAVAELVKRGAIRVILTTNFDRLMEQALEAVGVSAQVIARPEAVNGMAPLAHAPATLIKLHGDYKDLGTRNTPEELQDYPEEWQTLLRQVLDEYGLVVVGWSAEWDTALAHTLESTANRRYPLYWDNRSSKGETAQRLLKLRSGQIISAAGADELFTGLLASIDALDRLAEPPMSTAMAIARLKKYLPNPVHRIDLHDLVMSRVEYVREATQRHGTHSPGGDFEAVYDDYMTTTTPLLALLVEGVRHDRDNVHLDLWEDVLDRLVSLRTTPSGTFDEITWRAQHYPALLALLTIGLVAVHRQRDEVLVQLAHRAGWREPFGARDEEPVFELLHLNRVLDHGVVNAMTRWNGNRWSKPQSHMLRADLAPLLGDLVPAERFNDLFDDLEYRLGLLQFADPDGLKYPNDGEFVGERRWSREGGVYAEQRFRIQASQADESWVWWRTVGGPENLDVVLLKYREKLTAYQRWG